MKEKLSEPILMPIAKKVQMTLYPSRSYHPSVSVKPSKNVDYPKISSLFPSIPASPTPLTCDSVRLAQMS